MFLSNGYTPTYSNLFKDKELINSSPILEVLEKALSRAKSRPETPLYAQISNVLQNQLSLILTNQISPEESMELAQTNTQNILNSAGDNK